MFTAGFVSTNFAQDFRFFIQSTDTCRRSHYAARWRCSGNSGRRGCSGGKVQAVAAAIIGAVVMDTWRSEARLLGQSVKWKVSCTIRRLLGNFCMKLNIVTETVLKIKGGIWNIIENWGMRIAEVYTNRKYLMVYRFGYEYEDILEANWSQIGETYGI